jgi:hypothetical protein
MVKGKVSDIDEFDNEDLDDIALEMFRRGDTPRFALPLFK